MPAQNNFYPLAHIVCHDQNNVIGDGNNDLPWKCKEDMDYFRAMTLNRVVIMGHNTYESIPSLVSEMNNEPTLKGRIAIVISDPKRVQYDHLGIIDIKRLVESNRSGELDSLRGFTLFVPSLEDAINTCRQVHQVLEDYTEYLPNWIVNRDGIQAYIIGGGRLYAESLKSAYVREIHKTILPFIYTSPHNPAEKLARYPDIEDAGYRISLRTVKPCKIQLEGGKVIRSKMDVVVLRKRIGLEVLQ